MSVVQAQIDVPLIGELCFATVIRAGLRPPPTAHRRNGLGLLLCRQTVLAD
ncbi:hypothetical protein [Streptomyces phaeochromogenes]